MGCGYVQNNRYCGVKAMPFIESSDSLRSKMHLSDVSTPVLIGVSACIIVVVALFVSHIVGLATSNTFEVEKADETQVSTETEEPSAPAVPETIKVHIDGCVKQPGVYELEKDSRVQDAVALAGGVGENADTASVNLARILNDGEQVLIPEKKSATDGAQGTAAAPTESAANGSSSSSGSNSSSSAANSSGQASSQAQNTLVNINTADAEQLQTLPGVGAATAQKIIDNRKEEGPFISKEDLKRVSGIGDKKYQKLEAKICV